MNYTLIPLKDGGWEVRADSRFAPALTLDEARRVLIDALEAVTDQRAAEKAAPAIAHTGPEGTRVRYR